MPSLSNLLQKCSSNWSRITCLSLLIEPRLEHVAVSKPHIPISVFFYKKYPIICIVCSEMTDRLILYTVLMHAGTSYFQSIISTDNLDFRKGYHNL